MTELSAAFASVAETHSGIVFFVGDRAYKMKKPVKFGFLDFRDRAVRKRVCEREIELNRRLSPDVYLGVLDVVDADGCPVEHLIEMRRMPADRRLSALVRSGQPVDDHLRVLTHRLATFHAAAERSREVDDAADGHSMLRRWNANAAEMARFVGAVLDGDVLHTMLGSARRYLAGRSPLLDERIHLRRAVDGHGDLLADDIFCLDDGPRVLDCIEFDDRLRWGDALFDVAFLAMDLEDLDRPDLARTLLRLYSEASGDHWPASLAHHYIAHRAQIRSKVACLRWEQGDETSRAHARRLLGIAAAHAEAGEVRLIVVGGLPGTGKSTVASGIADALGAVVLRSDEVRKQLHGPGEELYTPGATMATYQELLDEAIRCLVHGESVVLDATWHEARWRDEARAVATRAAVELHEIQCVAPAAVSERRIDARSARGDDISDATVEVYRAMTATLVPWPSALAIDTNRPPDQVIADAVAAVGAGDGARLKGQCS
jgi:hypothetical protein